MSWFQLVRCDDVFLCVYLGENVHYVRRINNTFLLEQNY